MNLHEISTEFKQFNSMDWDKNSEVYKTQLELLEMPLQEKGRNIVSLLTNWQGDIKAIEDEIKRLQAMKKTAKNKHDNLKEWLRFNMEQNGIDKIECPLFNITLRKAVKDNVLVVTDKDALLKNYEKVVSPAVDTARLKADLKAGEVVKGAHLEDSKRGLLIK